ncbi:amidase [Pseudonocardia halophobica]|uniref:Amidase n=1 Tax=Pseudonocardia halophobica TaxID=29401 RepID=A0A9W6P0S5_9PSEU|nr:amidase [Pseudonocardia halophobica]GLL15655.1 amidase [Pseudonocardia halophobica]
MSALYAPWSLRGLVADLAAGRTTPAAAAERSRERIAGTEPELRAWVVPPAEAPTDEGSGPLGGIPLGVKDIIDVAGLPTRCGSSLRADAAPAGADAAVVAAWRHAGAVPVGKTVTTEFAYFAPGPTGNPAAAGHTPGGSSSGSAAAVASGQVPLALGSQTAGSVTRPAAFCGVAALVLTHDRLPVDGVTGLSPSLDSHGVFAAHVDDLALAFAALTGEPERAGARPPRLLFWSARSSPVDPEMRKALLGARDRWTAAGAVVDDLPEPELVDALTAAHTVVMAAEAAVERAAEASRADELSAPLAELLRRGAATGPADLEAARAVVAEGRARIADLLASYDAVVGPAALGPAPAGLGATGDPVLSRPWQALGFPALTVPGLSTPDGLPLGVQLVGAPRGETALLGTGCWVESRLR